MDKAFEKLAKEKLNANQYEYDKSLTAPTTIFADIKHLFDTTVEKI